MLTDLWEILEDKFPIYPNLEFFQEITENNLEMIIYIMCFIKYMLHALENHEDHAVETA